MPLRYLDDQAELDRFLELKAEKERIESELEGLKPLILSAVMEEPDGKAEHLGFELSYYRRKSYDYSEKVVEMEKQLKAAKKYEEASGIAEITKQQAILVVKRARVLA